MCEEPGAVVGTPPTLRDTVEPNRWWRTTDATRHSITTRAVARD